MKRWIVLGVILLAMGAVLGNLCRARLRGTAVTLAAVTTGRVVSAVYATGRVDTDRRATVRARITAPLASLDVGPGQAVTEGQLLGRQDDRELALAVERLASEVDEVRARLREAKDALARAEQLERDALIPANELVSAREAVREAEAALASRQSAVRLAKEREGWVVLRAPLSGTVTTILKRAGDPLREGDEVLTIVDLRRALPARRGRRARRRPGGHRAGGAARLRRLPRAGHDRERRADRPRRRPADQVGRRAGPAAGRPAGDEARPDGHRQHRHRRRRERADRAARARSRGAARSGRRS